MGLANKNALEKASRVAERFCPTVQIEVHRFFSQISHPHLSPRLTHILAPFC
jgi:hypothetical protein